MYPRMGVLLGLQAAVAEVAVGAIDDICVELRRMPAHDQATAQLGSSNGDGPPSASCWDHGTLIRKIDRACTVYVEVVNSFAVSLVLMSAVMMAVGVLFLYTRSYNNPECAGKCGYMGLHA